MTPTRPRIDRRAVFASAAAAALLAASGVSAETRPRRGGRFKLALSGGTRSDSFDIRRGAGLFMQVAAAGVVFDTLTEVAADGTLQPELATSWQGSADAANWELSLRRDVRFHDGQVFGAADVVASLALHQGDPALGLRNVRVLDAHRVAITLAAPNPDLPYLLSNPQYIMYPAKNMAAAISGGVGTGMYKVVRFEAGGHLRAERVASHYKDGRAGWFDEIELVSIPSAEVRAEALRVQIVDAADLAHGTERRGLLPAPSDIAQAAQPAVAFPAQIGTRAPMDNLRAPERWWFA